MDPVSFGAILSREDAGADEPMIQIASGDMLIDDYDVVDEKPDVAIITPDESVDEPEPEPLATDCKIIQSCMLGTCLMNGRRSYEKSSVGSTS